MVLKFAIRRFETGAHLYVFKSGVAKAPVSLKTLLRGVFARSPGERNDRLERCYVQGQFRAVRARTIVESNIERLVFSKLAELVSTSRWKTNCEV